MLAIIPIAPYNTLNRTLQNQGENMKSTFLVFITVVVTILALSTTIGVTNEVNKNPHVDLGPNQPYSWSTGMIGKFPGDVYELEADNYFELSQGDTAPIQAQYQTPRIGENEGYYFVSTNLDGEYRVSRSVKIYSLDLTSADFIHTTGDIVSNWMLATGICILFLVLFSNLVRWTDENVF
jgi:hypothetical protein